MEWVETTGRTTDEPVRDLRRYLARDELVLAVVTPADDDVVTLVDERLQLRNVEVLVLLHGLEIAELELGHAAAFFLVDDGDRNAVVFEHGGQILGHVRLVAIAVTGDKQRDLAAGVVCSRHLRSRARDPARRRRTASCWSSPGNRARAPP